VRDVLRAVGGWPAVEPEELAVPTFLYLGSADALALPAFERYQARLPTSPSPSSPPPPLRWRIFDGLDHAGEFDAVDEVVPAGIAFIRSLPVL
jgi:hypothetical protein